MFLNENEKRPFKALQSIFFDQIKVNVSVLESVNWICYLGTLLYNYFKYQ